jgi:hypothetical protein
MPSIMQPHKRQAQYGFDFLDYHFRGRKHWVREKSVEKLRETLKPLTQRNNGQSMQYVITRVNQILRGWFGYFQHSRGWITGFGNDSGPSFVNAIKAAVEPAATISNGGESLTSPNLGCTVSSPPMSRPVNP